MSACSEYCDELCEHHDGAGVMPVFGTPGCAGGVCAERSEAVLASLLDAAEKVVTAGMVYTATRPPWHPGFSELVAAANELSKRACEARAFLSETKT